MTSSDWHLMKERIVLLSYVEGKVANHIFSRENVEESCSLNAIGVCEDTLLNSDEYDVLERREVGQGRFRATRAIV